MRQRCLAASTCAGGANHELNNRFLHLDWLQQGSGRRSDSAIQGGQDTQQVRRVLAALGDDELSLKELMVKPSLADRNNFTKNYLNPALDAGLIERTISDKPTSRLQKYRQVR